MPRECETHLKAPLFTSTLFPKWWANPQEHNDSACSGYNKLSPERASQWLALCNPGLLLAVWLPINQKIPQWANALQIFVMQSVQESLHVYASAW